MKRVLLFACLLLVLASPIAFAADTGTYRILDYRVSLAPHADGKVDIDYYQKWQVTGGHIPWTTVGTANSNFQITKHGLAVRSIRNASQGGWQGVRIDLDQDYKPGQTFEVSFSLSQSRLFYADGESYKLDFTPGWYERAFTDHLEIRIKPFAPLANIKADPGPTTKTTEELIWSESRLGEGEKYQVSIAFPKKLVTKAIPEGNLKQGVSPGLILLIVVIVFLLIIFFGWLASQTEDGDGGYSGGGIFGGGGSGGGGGRDTGGGGGFGGRASSCACACVSCACACACAGGGAAGCARKLEHRCPLCRRRREVHEDDASRTTPTP